ncbi:HDL385Cp [Eremothecium sinecaudum]|uniref:HDL385Cp n=1 Tax=Eremothecium sinecaudum TaxID=45286 RepID=A0A0X8HRZ0_9SACH|nr:HDL385Cp [Eremothecium sinecaudum]AMD20359.1 HDL385Cp [Eremothecium sinecaudum]
MPEYLRLPQSIKDRVHDFPDAVITNLQTILREDEEETVVEHFQYEEKLDKSLLSQYSVIGLGFGLMSPVLGMSTTLSLGLINGGAITILGAFIISGFMNWLTALALGEIVSKYPIELHGSVAMLAPERYRLVMAYFTGWLMLLGSWIMNASIQYAGARLIISLITISDDDLITEEHLNVWTSVIYMLCITFTGVINVMFARFLEMINTVCIYWILYAVIFIDILLILFHHGSYRTFVYTISHFDNKLSGYSSFLLSFMIGGFQQSNFTLQGFSMLPALSDETMEPEKHIPNGISQSVLISTFCGIVYLVPILLGMPEPEEVMTDSRVMEIVQIFTKSTRSNVVAYFLVMLILGNMLFSGIGSITTSSRAVFSMSRDHAVPYYELWSHLSPDGRQTQIPKYSVYLSMGFSYVFGLLTLVSGTAYNAFIGASVVCLCSGTGLAIFCVMLGGRRGIKGAAVKIRHRLGWPISVVVLIWLCTVIFCMCMPVSVPVTIYDMNYTSVIFVMFLITIGVMYNSWGKYHFKIPEVSQNFRMETNSETGNSSNFKNEIYGESVFPSMRSHRSCIQSLGSSTDAKSEKKSIP